MPALFSPILALALSAVRGPSAAAAPVIQMRMSVVVNGISGIGEMTFDRSNGRFVRRLVAGPATESEGFDGSTAWRADASGWPRAEAIPEWRDGIRAFGEAFVGEPGTRTIRQIAKNVFIVEHPGRRHGAVFHIDAKSRLIDANTRTFGGDHPTLRFSHYRAFGQFIAPEAVRSTSADTSWTGRVLSIRVLSHVSQNVFSEPRLPADYTLNGATTVPMLPRKTIGDLVVPVHIDGGPALRFILDTGGQNVVDATVAKRLGLQVEGRGVVAGGGPSQPAVRYARVASLKIGRAELRNQSFIVLPGQIDSETDGIIGYEVLARLRASLNFRNRTVTLRNGPQLRSPTAVPYVLYDRQPAVEGALDGHVGLFALDSGSSGGLDVKTPFVQADNLVNFYRARVYGIAFSGVGGDDYGYVMRGHRLRLGKSFTHDFSITLLEGRDVYAGDSSTSANVGVLTLGRFNIDLDYRDGWVAIFPGGSAAIAAHRSTNRAGMGLELDGKNLVVSQVYTGTPAYEAGFRRRMSVIRFQGRPVSAPDATFVNEALHGKVGTLITLTTADGRVRSFRLRTIPW